MNPKTYFTPQRMTRIALLAAVSSVLFLLEITVVEPYKLDFSNLPVLLGGFSMGPLASILILAIKSLTGLLHSTSSFIGEAADFICGAAFVLPAVFIYHRNKNRKNALIGMAVGTICLIIVGVAANLFLFFPMYGMNAVIGMFKAMNPYFDSLEKVLLLITAPFNLLKGVSLSVLTYILYKYLSPILHGRSARS